MHNSNVGLPNQILLTQISLTDICDQIRSIVREELIAEKKYELQEKLLSPAETCKLFHPKITVVTLDSWAAKGLLIKHHLGGRVYYKYGQVIESLKTLKRYNVK